MALIGYLTLAYLAVGILFALIFAFRGSNSIDKNAAASGLSFRVLLVPGATLLWPYLLRRWLLAHSS